MFIHWDRKKKKKRQICTNYNLPSVCPYTQFQNYSKQLNIAKASWQVSFQNKALKRHNIQDNYKAWRGLKSLYRYQKNTVRSKSDLHWKMLVLDKFISWCELLVNVTSLLVNVSLCSHLHIPITVRSCRKIIYLGLSGNWTKLMISEQFTCFEKDWILVSRWFLLSIWRD